MGLTVAIIGRPNVGKSTLFNRLVGRKLAIVDDTPGVTRDRRSGKAQIGGLTFSVIDTAGLEEAFDESLEARMRRQTETAVAEADVVLMVLDARAGVTPMDKHFADWLRRIRKPVLVLANKCEGREAQAGLAEAYGMGLGEPIGISAAHGEGLGDLVQALIPFYADPEPDDTPPEQRPLQLAIVGRPNVGKSTLVNALIGEDRLLTGPEAGITRDAITVEYEWRGRPLRMVDTAGLRRKARIESKLEKMATQDTLAALRHAHVVALVLDSDAILDKQDLTIARHAVDEGRALVVAVNKWDATADKGAALQRLRDRLESSLAQASGVPTITMSALKRQGLDRFMDGVFGAYDVWNKRISTSQLNRWLEGMSEAHPPPLVDGRRLKIRYMTQVASRPPTFAMWLNKALEVPEAYARYLVNGMRRDFEMPGVPIRLLSRSGENPFDKDRE
ncbi:MAG TPA: ribosome biogenesis GTPase Der [Alphaproteobacteria bacterium]|nr:ribosome biogenesis GTPase Der [Alphaproteobacteria bacterium]